MGALLFHHLEQQRQVQRHDRDRRTGLGNHGLEHRDAGIALKCGEVVAQGQDFLVEVFLGLADGAVPVDILGQLFAQVSERGSLGAFCQHVGVTQGVDPQLPVFAAHHFDGTVDFFLGRRLQRGVDHNALVGVDPAQGHSLADRLEGGVMHHALRVGAAWRGQAVDHQVDLAQVFLDGFDGQALDLVRERIAIDALGVQAFFGGKLVESGAVVPAGRAALAFFAFFFKKHAKGVGATTKRGTDTRSQAVTGGRTEHQDFLRAAFDGTVFGHIVDLLFDVRFAANRVGGHTDKATNPRFYDHKISASSKVPMANGGHYGVNRTGL